MKIQTLTRFALVALVASVLFNTNAIGQKAPTNTAASGNGNGSTIIHDATLTGNGTTTAPLGVAAGGVGTTNLADGAVTTNKIANGAITAPKLGAGIPQSGQVLTYNGTGLSWQTQAVNNSVRPLRVVDSLGNEVGIPNGDIAGSSNLTVVRYIPAEDIFVYFQLNTTGIPDYSEFVLFYYESSDCSGTSYLLQKPQGNFSFFAVRLGNNFYYPTGTDQSRNIQSQKTINGQCAAINITLDFCSFVVIPVSDVGVPPFKFSR